MEVGKPGPGLGGGTCGVKIDCIAGCCCEAAWGGEVGWN